MCVVLCVEGREVCSRRKGEKILGFASSRIEKRIHSRSGNVSNYGWYLNRFSKEDWLRTKKTWRRRMSRDLINGGGQRHLETPSHLKAQALPLLPGEATS